MRVLTLAVAAVAVAAGIAGCGDSGGSNAGVTTGGASAGGACKSDDPFKIGAALPLSGPTAEGGKQTSAGIDIAVSDLNAKGGVLGRCAKVVYKDVQSDATKALQGTRELVDKDGVDVVVGVITSDLIYPVASVTGPAKKLLEVGATGAIDYKQNPYVFRTELNVGQIGAKYVDYIKSQLHLERLGLLATNDAYGKGVAKTVVDAANEQGVKISKQVLFDPAALDLRSQMQSIKDSGAQALVTVVYGQATIVVLKSRASLNWMVPIFGSNGFATKDIIEGVGQKALKNLLVTPTYERLNRQGPKEDVGPRVQRFRKQLERKLGVSRMDDLMQQYAAGYDMVMVFADAMNAAKTTDSDKVKEYLEQHPYDGLRAEAQFTPDNHDGIPDEAVQIALGASLEDGTLLAAPPERGK